MTKGYWCPSNSSAGSGLAFSLHASSCLVKLGCCVEDFPCLSTDSVHDSRLQSLSVATGLQGQMM
jgi:hypothetical protein